MTQKHRILIIDSVTLKYSKVKKNGLMASRSLVKRRHIQRLNTFTLKNLIAYHLNTQYCHILNELMASRLMAQKASHFMNERRHVC
jgi:hypothetical protein